jgi:hypothetical protein
MKIKNDVILWIEQTLCQVQVDSLQTSAGAHPASNPEYKGCFPQK